ncbi:MAG TPA: endopeptidase La [Anaerolineae bacterium]|nr:endopeptidase La [Anaerolineae bacterium]HQH37377.1 endopeptidase La [Anaerolineae bacterium]
MDWDKLPFIPEDLLGDFVAETREDGGPFEAIIMPLQELVVYPQMVTPLYVGRDASMQALEIAVHEDWPLVVVAQRNAQVEGYPDSEDLYGVGTEVIIARSIHLPDGTSSAIVQGTERVRILEYTQREPYLMANVKPLSETGGEDQELTEALMRAVLTMFEKTVNLNQALPEEAYVYAMNVESPGQLADVIAQMINLTLEARQDLLETLNVTERLQKVNVHLARELDVLELENQIHTSVQQEVDKSQREYFLREQLRAIQHELGETDIFTRDVAQLQEEVNKVALPDEVRQRVNEELSRLAAMPSIAPEVAMARTYLDWLLNVPWSTVTEDNLDIKNAARVLESQHYGLPKAKERILEYIAVRRLAPEKSRSTILCFVGPPGTGKTSLGRSIAEALGRKFVRVSLGGVRDEAEIRGHRRTYIGALPGRIIQTMRRAGTLNPVFMLDEIDKLGQDFRGDPSAALLEVLDPEQNHAFSDHYLEISYDLSKVLFITTANILDTIPPALQDRMEVIEFPGYTEEEKVEIARRFLLPRQVELNGLEEHPPHFPVSTLHTLIRLYTYEAGVRNLEREIGSLCRKATRRLAENKRPLTIVTGKTVEKYLGPPRFRSDNLEKQDEVGVAMGLAWTPNGGDLLPVEVALVPGKGNLILTGQLGEVMQESAQAALTYLRSKAATLGIRSEVFEKTDVHIHLPEGGIPKDGPSGGITMAVALCSAFTGRPVRHEVAMTGEITLRGRILAVGGLKAKLLTAHRADVKKVLLPARNAPDLQEIPRNILKKLDLVLVENMETVLEETLLPLPVHPPPGETPPVVSAEAA